MGKRVAEAIAQLVIVALTVWIAPGVAVDNGWSLVLAAAAVALASWALRPALVWFARRFGWVGTALTALFAQAVILGAALWFTPGSEVTSVGWLVLASWIYGAISAVVMWLFAASTDEYLIQHAVRVARRAVPTDDAEGVLFLQLDGVPAPVLDYELRAGNLVQPFGPQRQGLPFYLVCPQARREEPAVAAVFDWVRELRPLG